MKRSIDIDLLRDRIEASDVSYNEAMAVTKLLVRSLPNEPDAEYRFDMLDALNGLTSQFRGMSIDFSPIQELLRKTVDQDDIEGCLYVLGNSENPLFVPTIQMHLHDSDEAVRSAANFAFAQLSWNKTEGRRRGGEENG